MSPPRPPHRHSRLSLQIPARRCAGRPGAARTSARSGHSSLRFARSTAGSREAGGFACGCHGGGVVRRRTGRCCGYGSAKHGVGAALRGLNFDEDLR
ncbi:hypothetical protein B0H14DRAFT_3906211 [Mycena olivaceomarginata]|nr:hypothetical protein B0H14DRAFT_3906211 [Mycena olivaceomarginata]